MGCVALLELKYIAILKIKLLLELVVLRLKGGVHCELV